MGGCGVEIRGAMGTGYRRGNSAVRYQVSNLQVLRPMSYKGDGRRSAELTAKSDATVLVSRRPSEDMTMMRRWSCRGRTAET